MLQQHHGNTEHAASCKCRFSTLACPYKQRGGSQILARPGRPPLLVQAEGRDAPGVLGDGVGVASFLSKASANGDLIWIP